MLKGVVFKLRLTSEQAEYADRVAGICRAVWNTGLDQRRQYRQRRAWINYPQQCREMAEAKIEPGLEWLAQAPGHCLQQTLMDLDKACRAHGTWKIRFRAKDRWAPSFRFPEGKHMRVTRLSKRWGQVNLPKFGQVKFRMTRDLDSKVRSATVKWVDGAWWISFLIEDGIAEVEPSVMDVRPVVGVDRGVKVAVALSDGRLLDREFISQSEEDKIVRLQRVLSRQQGPRAKVGKDRQRTDPKARGRRQRPSNRYLHTKTRIAKIHARARRRRDDWLAKVAHELVQTHSMIVVEDLNIKGMTKRAQPKPEPDQPGEFLSNRAAQKSGLNKAILDKGWGKFHLQLKHQGRYTGSLIQEIPAPFTSLRCHQCGHTSRENRENQANFTCAQCGWHGNADTNASINIKAAGLAVTGRTRPTLVGSVNPQDT